MTYPTPYYVIDKEALENGICKLKNALDKYWGNSIIGYSYKTNSWRNYDSFRKYLY